MTRRSRISLYTFLTLGVCCGCGVKGDPIPPSTPPIIGRGEPTYRRASEDFEIEKSFEEGEENGEEESKKNQRQ